VPFDLSNSVKAILHIIWIRVWHDFVDCRRAYSKAEGCGSLVKDLTSLIGHNRVSHGLGRETETHGKC